MKLWPLIVIPVLCLGSATADTGQIQIVTPDVAAQSQSWPVLLDSADPWLEGAMLGKLNEIGLSAAVAKGQLSMMLVDITDPQRPRMAGFNAHEAMYAASLPKIAILLGAFHKASMGELNLDDDAMDTLTRMIRHSSNGAATQMLEKVGYDYLAELLQSDPYKLYDPQRNGGLWVGKAYASKNAWKRDPVNGLSHAATPFEAARFYYLLETGRLVSAADSRTMKEMLGEPAIHHKFVRGLEQHRPGSKIYRKSGTWRSYHADSAIVERDGRRYIAVAMANSESGSQWLTELIVAMDDVIHDPDNIARDHRTADVR